MVGVKESDIKAQCIQWLRFHKCFCWVNTSTGIYDPTRKVFRKLNGTGQIKGVSDILGIWKGKPLAIEVKKPGGRVSLEQLRFLELFERAGGIAFVAYGIKDLELRLTQ